METKADPTPSVENRRLQSTVSASSPKVAIFGAKAGFVIPKNKLSGSLVPTFRGGGKKDTGNTIKEETAKQVQRKTKWGTDLTQDVAVRKGRALAYQTRVEQITKQLKSGALETGDSQGFLSPRQASDPSSNHQIDKESQKLELLDLERREIIGEILCLNSGYKAPADYKPLLKEAKVPIPIKTYPGYNFIGILLGPESNTQKRLEEETGSKVRVHGTKKATGEKREITHSDIHEAQDAYEDLYIIVSADTYEKVDAAVALLELLLTPVSGSSAVATATSVSAALPPVDVNKAVAQPVLVTAQPGLPQYQPFPPPWFPNAPPNAASAASSALVPPPLPNSSFQFQPAVGSFSTLPYNGPPPPFGMMPRTSLDMSRPQLLMPVMQQPLNQVSLPQNYPMQSPQAQTYVRPFLPSSITPFSTSQTIHSGTAPASTPLVPVGPQAGPVAPTGFLPNRATTPIPLGSSGWPISPVAAPHSSLPSPIRPNQVVSPAAIISPPSALRPQPSIPVAAGGRPSAANFASPDSFPSRPSSAVPSFPSMSPHVLPTTSPVVVSSSFGAAQNAPMRMPSMISPRMPSPAPSLHGAPTPAFPQASTPSSSLGAVAGRSPAPLSPFAPSEAPRMSQTAVPSPQPPLMTAVSSSGSMPGFSPLTPRTTAVISPSIILPRPPRPISGDFTFQPLRAQVPTATPPGPNNQLVSQINIPIGAPQAPSFRLATQNSAQVSNQDFNQMGLPRTPGVPPRLPAFSSSNPVRPMPPAVQIGPPSFDSSSLPANLLNTSPARPVQFVQPYQNRSSLNRSNSLMIPNQHLGGNPHGYVAGKISSGPGGNQIYDPFSPTSISIAPRKQGDDSLIVRKPDADPEYEDLMASVGLK
ncbi:uncharacterized protein [Typha angustifolia]|uniref:uncharacterized protein n=1 Tax=Typha angustifolia TaxID=59011 RepID=UPI003C30041D